MREENESEIVKSTSSVQNVIQGLYKMETGATFSFLTAGRSSPPASAELKLVSVVHEIFNKN